MRREINKRMRKTDVNKQFQFAGNESFECSGTQEPRAPKDTSLAADWATLVK